MNNIDINVFRYEKQELYPVYISKEKFNDRLNLLLITKGKEQHYVLIKDFNQFMYIQTKHKERKYFCMYCLQCFKSEIVKNNHNDCGYGLKVVCRYDDKCSKPIQIYRGENAVCKLVEKC